MQIIIWNKTYLNSGNQIKLYQIKVFSVEETPEHNAQEILRALWEDEISAPGYDIDEHLEETYLEDTRAKVTDYDWVINMWIDETQKF